MIEDQEFDHWILGRKLIPSYRFKHSGWLFWNPSPSEFEQQDPWLHNR